MLHADDSDQEQPTLREPDPEDAWGDARLPLEDTDDDLSRPAKRSAAKEKGLWLRGAIDLDGQEYAGRASSRKDIYGEDSEDTGEDEEALIEGASADNDTMDLQRRQEDTAMPLNAQDQHGESSLPNGIAGAEDDGKASALEREVEALRAQDEAALTDRGDRAAKERARGAAVRNQKALWERMLEMRILLQRCLQGANRLAQPHMHPVACSINPGLQSGFRGLSDGSAATLDQLLDLHNSFLDHIPAALQGGAEASKTPGKKRKAGAPMDDTIAGQQWRRVDEAYQRFVPYRDSSLDRWHRKTMLMTGSAALRGNLKALNQSLSAQVSALSKDSGPAVLRARLPKALSCPLLGCPPQAEQEEQDDHLDGVVEERDAEAFDDSEFYQQLLKEFLEGSTVGSGAGALAASATAKKRHKKVERRASKGRKLRYQVMEKLVHFMTPVPRPDTTLAPQLFSNLFGQSMNPR